MKLDKEDFLSNPSWFDKGKFSYRVSTKKDNGRWRLYFVNNGDNKMLVNLSSEGWGRNGIIEDSD